MLILFLGTSLGGRFLAPAARPLGSAPTTVSRRRLKGITRVTAKREAKTCQNALNHRDHKCVHCLCFDCHSLEAKDAGRPRRKRNDEPQLNYGEKMLADGTIVADLTNKPNDSKRRRRN